MKIARTLPPVGYRFPIGNLVRGACQAGRARGYRQDVFETGLAEYLRVRKALAVSSGKAALTLILIALKALTGRRKVILPAYTCYSLPSSIVKAGLDVVPCDVARNSFDYDYECLLPMLEPDILCALSVHLFGIPSDTTRLKQLCRPKGIFVVEDAAQAMGVTHEEKPLGTLGDVGFYSLGRGKNVTCGSGGIVLTDSEEIANAMATVVRGLPENGLGENVRTFFTLMLSSIFISPSLYWFPDGIPFLRLGETIFHEDFPIRSLSNFQALLLRGWLESLASLNEVRRANADWYLTHINGVRDYRCGIPYLRFPIVLDGTDTKHRILMKNNGTALGISGMYPCTVGGIRELSGRLPKTRFPEAERLASSLITLPTHPLLSDVDRARICLAVNAALEDGLPRHESRIAS